MPFSKYLPEQMGSIRLTPPGPFVAGSYAELTLTYTAGTFGIDDTGMVKISWRTTSDMSKPQFDKPAVSLRWTFATCTRVRALWGLTFRTEMSAHGICSMTFVRRPRTGRACSEPTCQQRHWCRKMFERGLSHTGLPLKRKFRPRCCAKTRAGAPCIMRVVPGKRRCRFHGGLSTGPRTTEGRGRIAEAQRLRWSAFRAAKPTS